MNARKGLETKRRTWVAWKELEDVLRPRITRLFPRPADLPDYIDSVEVRQFWAALRLLQHSGSWKPHQVVALTDLLAMIADQGAAHLTALDDATTGINLATGELVQLPAGRFVDKESA